jgi:hypothetical protein
VKKLHFPNNVAEIDFSKLKTHEDFVCLSNFSKKEIEGATIEKKRVQKRVEIKKEKNLDLDRLRQIHNKKFPNKPFLLDEIKKIDNQ